MLNPYFQVYHLSTRITKSLKLYFKVSQTRWNNILIEVCAKAQILNYDCISMGCGMKKHLNWYSLIRYIYDALWLIWSNDWNYEYQSIHSNYVNLLQFMIKIMFSVWIRFSSIYHTLCLHQNIFSELRTPIQTNIETELKQTKKPLHAGGEHAAVNHTNTFFLFQHFSMF